jgi:hypothetical protein
VVRSTLLEDPVKMSPPTLAVLPLPEYTESQALVLETYSILTELSWKNNRASTNLKASERGNNGHYICMKFFEEIRYVSFNVTDH